MRNTSIINIYGCDDSFWCVHGPEAGRDGVALGKDQVKGLFDAPVRTSWTSGARQVGGTMKGLWWEPRDISLGFHIAESAVSGGDQEDIMSRFRRAFDYRPDPWDHDARLARIEWVTDRGARSLDVALYEAPDFNPGIDPLVLGYGNPVLPLRAGQPFWYEPDVITSWSTSAASGSGVISGSNPTDVPMRHKWILTRGQWTLPDLSWEGPPGARVRGVSKATGRDESSRGILMPPLGTLEGGATVDLDPMELMVRDAHRTNLLGRMPVPGRFFEYVLPSHLQGVELPVSVTGAPAGGAMVQLVAPRLWLTARGGQ